MQVFVGGLGGCGKRVIQEILQRAGFFLGRPGMINGAYDSPKIITHYQKMLAGKADLGYYREAVLSIMDNVDKWSSKSGMSMLCIPHIREAFPNMKYILVARDPVNQIVIKRTYSKETAKQLLGLDFGLKPFPYYALSSDVKACFWKKAYQIALESFDGHVVSFDDMCLHPDKTIGRLFTFLGIDEKPGRYINLITKPDDFNIGYERLPDGEIAEIKRICQPITETILGLSTTTT